MRQRPGPHDTVHGRPTRFVRVRMQDVGDAIRMGGRAQRQPSEPSCLQRRDGKHMVDRILDAPAPTQSQGRRKHAIVEPCRVRSGARCDPQRHKRVPMHSGSGRDASRRHVKALASRAPALRLTAAPRSAIGGGFRRSVRVCCCEGGERGAASRGREPCGSSRTTQEPVHRGALLVRQRVSAQSTQSTHVSTQSM